MQLLQIPLLNETTDQTVDITINDIPYSIRVLWNERFGYFALSINDLNDDPILTNIKMVRNYPLVGIHKDIRLPIGDFYFYDERGQIERPRYDSLGVDYNLYYYEPSIAEETAQQVISVSEPVIGSVWDSGLSEWDSAVMGGPSVWDQ